MGIAIALLIIGALIAYFANDPTLKKVGIAACVVGLGIVLWVLLLDAGDEEDLDAVLLPGLLGLRKLRLLT